MTVTNYVVPHHGFGTPRRLTVDTVNPEMFLQLLSLAESSHLPVTLSGHSSTGFRVHHGEDIVGVIPASQAADYSELDWIIDAGLTPQATAEIALREDAAEETIPAFEVLLPEPGLCVPLNIPPAQRWGMLSGQRALHITEFAVPASSLPTHPAHLLVRLTNNRHFFRRSIEVHLDDELVATIPRERAPWLSDTIAGFNHEGLIAVARAYFISDGQPTLTVYSEEGTPESHFAVGTAGIIAAAAGAAAVKVTNSGKAHAASLPAGGIEATGAAKTAGTAATQSAQALSLNSAGAAAVTGTKIAAASTGLKVACAAGVAVVVGGAANFASSGNSSGSHHDNLAESAFEENTLAVSTSHSADADPAAIEDKASDVADTADIVAADAHLPEERDDTDATRALSPTGFSEPTEPTELTEPAEPTELAEPTERTPLPAAEEAATSPQADHLPHTAPTTTPRTTAPTAEELDAPEDRRTEASTAPNSSPRSTENSTESTTSHEASRSAEPPTTTHPLSTTSRPRTTPPIHVPRPTPQTQATPSPTVVTTTPKPPAEPTRSTSKAAPTTTPVGEDRTAPHDEPTAPSTPPATTPVTTRVSTPPTAAPAPSTTSAPATPTPTTKPKPTSKPKPTTKPTPTAKPTPTSKPKPTTQPQPTRKPEPTKEPEPSREPDPTPEQSDRGGWVIIIDFG
ncbi:hypothetical protein [Corynebacterium aurimucosum]|uniref:hypothetical protein n=1 Tax=Corynebacterium aurimucosum TaxID=169292 RepID=UPI000A7F095D|nr:hypothetical protein [Corynebacterium aurimucosum]